MLAVLKAGGAFVPMDPTHPIARIHGLVQAVEANIMVCSPGHDSRLASAAETVVALDEERLEVLAVDGGKELLPSPAHGKNAAYVLFTSGSTGEPKVRLKETRC